MFLKLELAIALLSSVKSKAIKLDKTIVVGEIGLTGEVRPIAQCEKIVNEASKLGFKNIIIPQRNANKIINKNINIIGIASLKDVLSVIF